MGAIGQQICWLKSLNAEVAIVEKFLGKCIHDPALHGKHDGLEAGSVVSAYLLKRTVYALLHHVEGVNGQQVRVGATVQFVDYREHDWHADFDFDALWNAEGVKNSFGFVVKAICKSDKCVELEHTFIRWHHEFGPLEAPDDAGCPQNHEWKCKHLGHPGECRHRCFGCDAWLDRWVCPVCPGGVA